MIYLIIAMILLSSCQTTTKKPEEINITMDDEIITTEDYQFKVWVDK